MNDFNTALETFKRSTLESMESARACANFGIEHFAQHGDLSQCQKFFDAMTTTGKNYVRKTAFLKWLVAFAPVTLVGGKTLKKDEKRKDEAVKVDEAKAVAFWEFAPDTEQMMFEENDVVVALQKVIKKFEGEKFAPKDEAAKAKLAAAEKLVANFAKTAKKKIA